MVNLLVALLLLVVGLALAFGGFLFFRAGLYLLGALMGLSVGLTAMTNPELSTEVGLVLLVAGPLVGLALAVALRLLLVASVGASVGWLATAALLGTPLVPSTLEEIAVVGGGAVVGIVAAYFLETAVIVVVSASWGSLLVALALGASASTFVSDPGTLLSTALAIRGVAFVLGVASQAGLWLYLRRNLGDDEDARTFLFRKLGQLVGSARSGGNRDERRQPPDGDGNRDERRQPPDGDGNRRPTNRQQPRDTQGQPKGGQRGSRQRRDARDDRHRTEENRGQPRDDHGPGNGQPRDGARRDDGSGDDGARRDG